MIEGGVVDEQHFENIGKDGGKILRILGKMGKKILRERNN